MVYAPRSVSMGSQQFRRCSTQFAVCRGTRLVEFGGPTNRVSRGASPQSAEFVGTLSSSQRKRLHDLVREAYVNGEPDGAGYPCPNNALKPAGGRPPEIDRRRCRGSPACPHLTVGLAAIICGSRPRSLS